MGSEPLKRSNFPDIVIKALRAHGGGARLAVIAKYIWDNYREELEASGPLLYTWQYDMRWAATKLRHGGVMRSADESIRGVWELA